MSHIRVLILSRYGFLGASSRVRSMQYIPFLERNGVQVDVAPLFDDNYICTLYKGKRSAGRIIRNYFGRFRDILGCKKYDIAWIEKEFWPWAPSMIELLSVKMCRAVIVDYDDAVFHRYDQHRSSLVKKVLGGKHDVLMRRADLVTAGNDYIVARARAAGARRVEYLPTVVDKDRYRSRNIARTGRLTFGWIGTPVTAPYLKSVAPVFAKLSRRFDIRCVAIGARSDQLAGTPFEVRDWDHDTEVRDISALDVGIMPLPDTDWARGKCGYKLIQYMACRLPVIASPVGVNRDIVHENVNGFLAGGEDEWEHAASRLIKDHDLRRQMGREGRMLVEREYSLQVHAPRLLAMMRSLVG